MNGKAELFGEWNRGLAGWCVNKDNGWERREWTWWNGFILWVCLREREIEQQGVLLLLVLQDSHLQVSGLEEKNVREAGGWACLSGRCCSHSVLYLHNSRAETEPDLIIEFITETRDRGASNRGGERKVPCGISTCFITLQTEREEERRDGAEKLDIRRITSIEEEEIKEQKGREKQ